VILRRSYRTPLALAMAAAFVAIATGCTSSGSGTAQPTTTNPPAPAVAPAEDVSAAYVSQVATAQGSTIAVYANPDDAEPKLELDNPWVIDPDVPDATVSQVFLVIDEDPENPVGDEWVQVMLPIRPNGSTGWVRRADVTIAENSYRVDIELAAKRITVTNAGSVVYQGAVASGKDETPTPTGNYYLRVLLQAPDPNTVYGPFAYGLSSYSETFETFNGADAEIGIHGNNDASVLGTAATAGCIRMDNESITALTGLLPLGTPVDIIA